MISLEMFILGLSMMFIIGVFMAYLYARDSYDAGFMDAVQLHEEGRLTYCRTEVNGQKDVLSIDVDLTEDM